MLEKIVNIFSRIMPSTNRSSKRLNSISRGLGYNSLLTIAAAAVIGFGIKTRNLSAQELYPSFSHNQVKTSNVWESNPNHERDLKAYFKDGSILASATLKGDVGVDYQGLRTPSGRETDWGDIYFNAVANIEQIVGKGILGFEVDWVPKDTVLNTENATRLTSRGEVNRSYLLPHFYYIWGNESNRFAVRGGGMRVNWLPFMDDYATQRHAHMPSLLSIAYHDDLALMVEYTNKVFGASLAVINGDRRMGVPNVFEEKGAKTKSDPRLAGTAYVDIFGAINPELKNTLGTLNLYAMWKWNKYNSNPGQEADTNLLGAIEHIINVFGCPLISRAYYGQFERGLTWGDPDRTTGYGGDVAVKGLEIFGIRPITLRVGHYILTRNQISYPSDIWPTNNTTREEQTLIQGEINQLFGHKNLDLVFSGVHRELDDLRNSWAVVGPPDSVFVGIKYKF